MNYLVKKGELYLYKTKTNGYGYFSSREHAKKFSKMEAEKLAKRYKGKMELL